MSSEHPQAIEPLVPGTELGPYRVEGILGKGGMGAVYKARDTRLDRYVAIKVSAERFSSRFDREARAIAAFNYPHICTLYDVGPNYLVMDGLSAHESAQVPLFRLLGTPAADKRHVVFDSPHDVRLRRDDLIREVLAWYDKYLGPVN